MTENKSGWKRAATLVGRALITVCGIGLVLIAVFVSAVLGYREKK